MLPKRVQVLVEKDRIAEILKLIQFNSTLAQDIIDTVMSNIKKWDTQKKWRLVTELCKAHTFLQMEDAMYVAVARGKIEVCMCITYNWFSEDKVYVLGEACLDAIKLGHKNIWEFLFDSDRVNIDYQGTFPRLKIENITPLIYAVMIGNVELVIDLVKRGADLQLDSSHGNAMHIAKQLDNPRIINCLSDNELSPPMKRKRSYLSRR